MQAHDYLSLLRHMEWADSLTWQKVSGLSDGQHDVRLIDLLYHLHTVQWVYLQVWRQQAPAVPPRNTFSDLATVAAWARPYYTELQALLGGLTRERLAQPLPIPWGAEVAERYGPAEPATFGETVLQVVLHSTYHRAQVATRVKELGATPDLTDYIAWVWMNRPEPRW